MTFRQTTERAIIGTIVACNSYAAAGCIVNARNFSKWGNVDYANIFKTFETMWTTLPIDLVSLSGKLTRTELLEVNSCVNNISSYSHLQYHCFILLELDLKTKFAEIIKQAQAMISISDMPSGYAAQTTNAFAQVLQELEEPNADVLITILNAIEYITGNFQLPEVITEPFATFSTQIAQRTLQIKKQLKLNHALNQVEHYSNTAFGVKQMALRELAALTSTIALAPTVSDVTLFAINQIRKSL